MATLPDPAGRNMLVDEIIYRHLDQPCCRVSNMCKEFKREVRELDLWLLKLTK